MGKLTVEDANKELERLNSTSSNKNISLKLRTQQRNPSPHRLDSNRLIPLNNTETSQSSPARNIVV